MKRKVLNKNHVIYHRYNGNQCILRIFVSLGIRVSSTTKGKTRIGPFIVKSLMAAPELNKNLIIILITLSAYDLMF